MQGHFSATGMPHSGDSVQLDASLCVTCGACVRECPAFVFAQDAAGVRTDAERLAGCIGCGHCMAVCPSRAVRVPGLRTEQFPTLPKAHLTPDTLQQFFHARRAVRRYKPEPVPRDVLEQVLTMAATAPVGLPPTEVEVLVITDPAKLARFAPAAFTMLRQLQGGLRNPIMRPLIRLAMGREMVAEFETHFLPLFGDAERRYAQDGLDCITWGAPAVLAFHAPAKGLCPRENALIAMSYAMLAAHAHGLGTCVNGILQNQLNDRAFRAQFPIPQRNKVYGAMTLGFSVDRPYHRGIQRTFKDVTWM